MLILYLQAVVLKGGEFLHIEGRNIAGQKEQSDVFDDLHQLPLIGTCHWK
jgi:hypothetical protein